MPLGCVWHPLGAVINMPRRCFAGRECMAMGNLHQMAAYEVKYGLIPWSFPGCFLCKGANVPTWSLTKYPTNDRPPCYHPVQHAHTTLAPISGAVSYEDAVPDR